ncbi:4-substituted benzoates-glutamate ligase GH3.12 [Cardamine amara subsp. amara]|uniref:4-substituted benzoates-glutamate ligase GH3.12 n=1 Tax=Cardamine amara subsp. amara TaxID=228776 RepID=A0ABD0ZEC8_CARAN
MICTFKAVNGAKLTLESSNLMLIDFTSYADISTVPGHYVVYWEVKDTKEDKSKNMELKEEIFSECCLLMEDSFDEVYKNCRFREKSVGPLEIKVVRHGTFDSLMDFFISQGASIGQYKTPRCIKSGKAFKVLEKSVVATFFSTE